MLYIVIIHSFYCVFIVWICHDLFIHSPLARHLACFQLKLLWTLVSKPLCGPMLSLSLASKYLGGMAGSHGRFFRISCIILHSHQPMYKSSSFLPPGQYLVWPVFLILAIVKLVIAHCGSDLHFPNDLLCWLFLCAYLSILYLWWSIFSNLLLIKKVWIVSLFLSFERSVSVCVHKSFIRYIPL